MKNFRAKGFTLIELLVVMFIISIVSCAVLLTINRNENKRLETFTNELVQLITLAEEEAMLQPIVLGVNVKSQDIKFMSLMTHMTKKEMRWQAFNHHALKIPNMPDNLQMDIRLDNKVSPAITNNNESSENQTPQIIISTNGDVTPFTIYIGKKGEKPIYSVTGRSDGLVTSQLLS